MCWQGYQTYQGTTGMPETKLNTLVINWFKEPLIDFEIVSSLLSYFEYHQYIKEKFTADQETSVLRIKAKFLFKGFFD